MAEHPDGYLYYSRSDLEKELSRIEQEEAYKDFEKALDLYERKNMGNSYMGPNDDYEKLFSQYQKHVPDAGTYEEIRKTLKEERERALTQQAEKLAELERALQDAEIQDDDEFEIGGAL